jgi:hypothetical protein
MKMIEELKKAIYAKYLTTTLYTVDNVLCYQDHVPSSVNYPCVCFYHISSINKCGMIATGHATGFDYADVRIQFGIYVNDRQYAQAEDIADRIEDTYHKHSLTLGSSCTNIGTLVTGAGTRFYDENQKIWTIAQDYKFFIGK